MTLYDDMGGAEPLRALVDRFYDLMSERPDAAVIRAMHPADLASSREKLFMFLSGWSGGPELYRERHGHPRLRARHLPFTIGDAERDAWLACMRQALLDLEWSAPLRAELMTALEQVASFMRNASPAQGPDGA
jgi:hemoglobin